MDDFHIDFVIDGDDCPIEGCGGHLHAREDSTDEHPVWECSLHGHVFEDEGDDDE